MSIDVQVPDFPESVSDGTLVSWRKHPGDTVKRSEILADIETDKVVFEIPAPADGVLLEVLQGEGATVVARQIIARLGAPQVESGVPAPAVAGPPAGAGSGNPPSGGGLPVLTPSAQKLIADRGLEQQQIAGTGKGGRVLKEDVLRFIGDQEARSAPAPSSKAAARPAPETGLETESGRLERRVPMTRLRARIAERLVSAQHTAAILTTFNEVNMRPVMDLRQRYRERFEKEYGVRLGYMSFFVKASVESLKQFPEINASLDGGDIVYHGYYDIGIAVSSPRGLVVPILRDADRLSMAAIESQIGALGQKSQDGTLSMEEITGGTFTITNGGVFGSLLSTPILNPPQSAILGMHKIEDRPVAEDGQVVIRPMMYLALSYDHRIIDGREAVRFLVTVKEMLEDPARILLEV
ncbi:MAG: 2-oxoglutarate dehydrogenase complex dihydrolipoyllysine-residue succinyltransferase [Gammaproteobacteria bacterium]|nr:2-oxoglutarate dehydrogenase complex dihydrolipoyllysine-residue succinyltransferase [Gammaproteobacteria bacterium]